MTDKEPEKLVYVEPSKVYTRMWNVLLPGGLGIMREPTQEKAECAAMYLNTAAESFAQRRVDEALERLDKSFTDLRYMDTMHSGHDTERIKSAVVWKRASEMVRAMKSQGATNG